jgi:hypothetical protein
MIEAETLKAGMRPVYIGRRLVGEIPENEWLFILHEVGENRELWRAQVKNLFRVAARIFGLGFISVPLGIFWTAVILGWLGKPVAFEGHVGALLNHPELVVAGVALAVGAMRALGIRLGYVNYFAKARSVLLKDRLEIDVPGECRVP